MGNFPNVSRSQKQLWSANLWTAGYSVGTVGKHGYEKVVENYVRNHGKDYTQILRGKVEV